jgi:NitT/TauT family transport system substrate-binding protein
MTIEQGPLDRSAIARPSRRSLSNVIAAAVVAFGAWVPMGASAQSAPPTKLDFAGSVTWLGQAPIMVALEKGFFKDEGLDVTFQTILNSSDRIAALSAGSVAFSNLGRIAVIADMARGNEAFYYFANVDDSPGNEGCWAKPGIASVKDMKGKKVAANTSAEITLAGLLRANGMTQRDIQYLNLPPNEMAGALTKGDIDVACVWQPLLGGLEKAVPEGKLLGTDKDTDTYAKYKTMASPDIMIISRKLVDQHPAQAAKIASAVMKGADYLNANMEESAGLIAKYFKKEPAELLPGLKSFQYFGAKGWPQHMELHVKQMQELAQWLHENGKIPSLPDVKKWENTSFLPKS